eukprot:g55626.t1
MSRPSASILSPALLKQLGKGAVLAGPRKKPKSKKEKEREKKEKADKAKCPKLTRKQEKKQTKIVERKKQTEERQRWLSEIESQSISDSQRKLMSCSSALGKKQSLRDRLRQSFLEERAGLATFDEPEGDPGKAKKGSKRPRPAGKEEKLVNVSARNSDQNWEATLAAHHSRAFLADMLDIGGGKKQKKKGKRWRKDSESSEEEGQQVEGKAGDEDQQPPAAVATPYQGKLLQVSSRPGKRRRIVIFNLQSSPTRPHTGDGEAEQEVEQQAKQKAKGKAKGTVKEENEEEEDEESAGDKEDGVAQSESMSLAELAAGHFGKKQKQKKTAAQGREEEVDQEDDSASKDDEEEKDEEEDGEEKNKEEEGDQEEGKEEGNEEDDDEEAGGGEVEYKFEEEEKDTTALHSNLQNEPKAPILIPQNFAHIFPELAAGATAGRRIDAHLAVDSVSASNADGHAAGARQGGATFVRVSRLAEVEAVRSALPIIGAEQQLMEAVQQHDVVIVCGPTGSGKTTQVPQFLFEAGYSLPGGPRPGLIAVTEPRRVAAISTAQRVRYELNLETGEGASPLVAHQVRFDATASSHTRICFMTEGVLLRELQRNVLLSRYSVVVLDEAHERGLNTDLLIGLLSRVVPLRRKLWQQQQEEEEGASAQRVYPLKLLVMSATLRVHDFLQNALLFPGTPPPLVEVEGRQFPVTVHFARKTAFEDYVDCAIEKVLKIHTRLPAGGVLLFLTGKQEIDWAVQRLRAAILAARQRQAKRRAETAAAAAAAADHPGERSVSTAGIRQQAMTLTDGTAPQQAPAGAGGQEEQAEEEEDFVLSDDEQEDEQGATKEGAAEVEAGQVGRAGQGLGQDEEGEYQTALEEENMDAAEEPTATSRPNTAQNRIEILLEKVSRPEVRAIPRARVLPLYSLLSPEQQMQVFATKPRATKGLGKDKGKDKGISKAGKHTHKQKTEQVCGKKDKDDAYEEGDHDDGAGEEEEERLIVVATNVAETSLTIPGIRYVVDAGREKQKVWHARTGAVAFRVGWISQASAAQRTGRAGRVGPGHCYRLYSSACFDRQFPLHSEPEILRAPIEGTVLSMKSMHIQDIERFPFPTPPAPDAVRRALQHLLLLGALQPDSQAISSLGEKLALFPLSPRFAKMLVLGHQGGCLPYVLALVAALSVPHLTEGQATSSQPAQPPPQGEEGEASSAGQAAQGRAASLAQFADPTSDLLTLLRLLGAYAACQAPYRQPARNRQRKEKAARKKLCTRLGLRERAMQECMQLVGQLAAIVCRLDGEAARALAQLQQPNTPNAPNTAAGGQQPPRPQKSREGEVEDSASRWRGDIRVLLRAPPSPEQLRLLRQVLTAGLVDQVARRMPLQLQQSLEQQLQQAENARAGVAGQCGGARISLKGAYQLAVDGPPEPVFIHAASVLAPYRAHPEWLVFQEQWIGKPHTASGEPGRTFLKGVTAIEPEWLLTLAPPALLTRSAPLEDPPPMFCPEQDAVLCFRQVRFGPQGWPLPLERCPFPANTSAEREQRIKHFARLLVAGAVWPALLRLRPFLTAKPALCCSAIVAHPAAKALVHALQEAAVCSRAGLKAQLRSRHTWLLPELQAWVQPAQHAQLATAWSCKHKHSVSLVSGFNRGAPVRGGDTSSRAGEGGGTSLPAGGGGGTSLRAGGGGGTSSSLRRRTAFCCSRPDLAASENLLMFCNTSAGSCSDSGCQSSQSAGSRSFQRQGGHSRKRIDERTVSEQHAKRLKRSREYQACKRSAAVVEAEFPSDEELQAMLLSAQGRQRFPKTSALLETNKAQAHMAQQPNSVSPEGAAADSEVPVSSGKKGVEKRASKQAATIKPTASNSSGAAAAASTRQPRSKAAKVDSYAESDAEDDEGSEYEEPATHWMCAYCNYPNPLGPGDQEFAGCINCGGLASSDDESDLEEDE